MRTPHGFGRGLLLLAAELGCAGSAATPTPRPRSSIPYVATRNDAVKDMLWLAGVGKQDVVYDLGSGDGRVVVAAVRDFGARRSVGVENDAHRIRQSREGAEKAGLTGRVELVGGDLFTTDFSEASVVTLFLGHRPNIELRPKLFRTLGPGARVLSHQFGMGEWAPDKELTVRTVTLGMWGEAKNPYQSNAHVPDFTANEMHFGTSDKILMWVVPAKVAGIWRGKVETPDGLRDCQLTLHQQLSHLHGSLRLSGATPSASNVRADLWGDHLRYEGGSFGTVDLKFDGRVSGDSMKGTMAVVVQGQLCERRWEGRRDPVDLTGQWGWNSVPGNRPVRLRVERRDGDLIASYFDRDKQIPVPDFYDFGGGFYFTLFLDREGQVGMDSKDTGWLIGEGIVDQGKLRGTIHFYPPEPDGDRASPPVVHQEWTPRPVKP